METPKQCNKPFPIIKYAVAFFTLIFSFVAVNNLAYADEIPISAEDIKPIMVGQTLPQLTLKDTNNKSFNLNQAISQKPALLIFYRGGWCPYCNAHLANLRKIEKELLSMGFQIFAVSPDQPKFLRETLEKQKLDYHLLSDSNMAASKALGLAYKVDNGTLKNLGKHGIDIEKNSGKNHHLLPVPAAMLVNTKGEVTFTFIAPNYKTRIDNSLILAAAKAQINSEATDK